ncbi:MAG: zinc-binding dehydrogenase, partial [Mariprofundaceae bacterium]|nr:zinc-binding dehydrogenase [Mariprofundaceae bacterium]
CYGGLGQRFADKSLGNYAEYALVPEHFLASKPKSLGYLQAAAAPLVLITAWEALFDRARLRSGQKVFIQGGTGGVGHVAIQLAKIAGCDVATTASNEGKSTFVRALGADCVIDYTREDIAQSLLSWTNGQGVDVLLDTVDSSNINTLIPAMNDYAHYVSLLQCPDDVDYKALRLKNISLSQELMLTPMISDLKEHAQRQASILEQCGQFMDEGQLNIHVSKVLPLEDVAQAHDLIEHGHTQGKIVLAIAGDEAVE